MIRPFLFLQWIFFSTCVLGQQQERVDFTRANADIRIDPGTRSVYGEVVYRFKVLDKADSVFLNARNMTFSSVLLDGKSIKYTNDDKVLVVFKKMSPGKDHQLALKYKASPGQALYFVGWEDDIPDNNQVWSQGQGKYTSHWLPSFDDMTEKVVFNTCISFDPRYEVIANGVLRDTLTSGTWKEWCYGMDHPMSSYLLAVAIGHYDKKTKRSASGIPQEMYYYPEDSLRLEPTYRYSIELFDFLEKEIGVPYPWQVYKQVPAHDFLYAGMENTATTIFSDTFMIDSLAFIDKNYVNVNAHELAHQWFGDLVTEKDGNHHWLHEGFATYYAYLAEKSIFGEEYFYWKLYESARQLDYLASRGEGEALTDPQAGSLTFYEKGALALCMLEEKIGAANFKRGIRNYLQAFKFGNVSVSDFIDEMEKAGGNGLSGFSEQWLNNADFDFEGIKGYLIRKSPSLASFFKLQRELITGNEVNETVIRRYWDNTTSVDLKKQIILDYHKSLSEPFLKSVMATGDVRLRQAVANSIEKLTPGLRPEFESLLEDPSYLSKEIALYKLWVYFPGGRAEYLDKTRDIIGFPDKNVRILWLTLAVLTKEYLDVDSKKSYLSELRSYTSARYAFEVRQNAFRILNDVLGLSDENILDLVNACTHHSWQFRKFARSMMDTLLANAGQRQRVRQLSKELKGEELRYIKSKLDTE